MKRFFTLFAAALFTLVAAAQADADRIIGNYMSKLSDNDAKAKVFKYNGGYRMQIYWLRNTHNPDGTLKTDKKNPDKA